MKKINNNNDLIFLIHKLQNSQLDKSDLLGVVCFMIYSKEIFPKNGDIEEFLDRIFNIHFLEYVFKSRTLIVARVSKVILLLDEDRVANIKLNLLKYFEDKNEKTLKNKKKKNANDKMETWLKGL